MAGHPETTAQTSSLKYSKLSFTMKQSSTHNAKWETSSSLPPRSYPFAYKEGQHQTQREPEWPLTITLKEKTRRALFVEFGLSDPSARKTTTKSLLLRNNSRNSSNRLLVLCSSERLFQKVQPRMPGFKKSSASSPSCGGLRQSCHLASTRPATVSSLHKPTSIFRQALKQQKKT